MHLQPLAHLRMCYLQSPWFLGGILLVGAAVGSSSARAAALSSGGCGKDDCSVAITQLDVNTERVDLTRPVVTQEAFSYDAGTGKVIFMPGDQITIEDAGGCVQTGGAGRTWKRYVNPTGPNSDRLYFGSMEIPGVLAKTRFSDLIGSTIAVPAGNPAALVLYYEDDPGAYGDNRYYSPDPGTENQCVGADSGPAHVTLNVVQAVIGAPPPPPLQPAVPRAALPWDLTPLIQADNPLPLDDNGFLLNPRWFWQRPGGGAEAPAFNDFSPGVLSTQITSTDSPSSGALAVFAVCVGDLNVGHVNWFDVTYTGTASWAGHSCGRPGDDDYNIDISGPTVEGTSIVAGGTKDNPDHIHGEFKALETIDYYTRVSAWWNKFHDAADKDRISYTIFNYCDPNNPSATGPSSNGGSQINPPFTGIEGHDVIMTGLMGLDTVIHDGKHGTASSELHPVHGFAIRQAKIPNAADDRWAVFARNWGDEGQCSHNQHYVIRGIDETDVNNPIKSIAIRIPRPPGVPPSATATFGPATSVFKMHSPNTGQHCNPNGPNAPGDCDFEISQATDGAVITFFLNIPTAQSQQFGELQLKWGDPPGGAAALYAASASGIAGAQPVSPDQTPPDSERPDQESVGLLTQFYALDPAEQDVINRRVEAASPPQSDAFEPATGGTAAHGRTRHLWVPPARRIGPLPGAAQIGPVTFEAPDEGEARLRDIVFGGICEFTRGITPLIPEFCPSLNVAHIEAEAFLDQSGNVASFGSEIGFGSGITAHAGDWVRYPAVNFRDGRLDTFVAFLATGQAGGRVDVRLDDLNGTQVATLRTEQSAIDSSGSPTYSEQSVPMASVIGVHDIFVVFSGSTMMNFDWYGLRRTGVQLIP